MEYTRGAVKHPKWLVLRAFVPCENQFLSYRTSLFPCKWKISLGGHAAYPLWCFKSIQALFKRFMRWSGTEIPVSYESCFLNLTFVCNLRPFRFIGLLFIHSFILLGNKIFALILMIPTWTWETQVCSLAMFWLNVLALGWESLF